jgi:tape measure domain-containing protein
MTVRERIDFTGNAAEFAERAAAAVDSLRRSMRSLAKESSRAGLSGPGLGGGSRSAGASNQRAPKLAAREQIKLTDAQKDYTRGLNEEAKLKRRIDTFDANRVKRMDAAKRKLRGMEDAALGRKPRGLGPALPRQEVGGLGGMMNSAVGNLTADGVVGAAKMAASVGKMALDGAAFKESTIRAFTLQTKSAEKGKALWLETFALSKQLGLRQDEVANSLSGLMASGFDEKMSKDLVKGMADLKQINPNARADGIVTALSQIKATGKLQGDELMQLNEAGVSSEKVYAALAKRLGKSKDEIIKMQGEGKLLANDVIPAVLDSIKEATGKDLGKTAEEGAKGLAAQMDRLAEAPSRFFRGIDSDAEGFSKLKGLMEAVNNYLDPTTQEGQKLVQVMNDVVGVLSDMGTESSETFTQMQADFAMIGESSAVFTTMGGAFTTTMQTMGLEGQLTSEQIRAGLIGGLVTGITGGLPMVASATSFMLAAAAATAEAQQKSIWASVGVVLGGSVVQGIVQAMSAGGPKMQAGAKGLADQLKAGLAGKKGVDAHSPSVWSFNLGGDVKQGLINSFHQDGPLFDSAARMAQGGVMGPMAANSNVPTSLVAGSNSSTTMAPVIHINLGHVSDVSAARAAGAAAGSAAARSFSEEMAVWTRQRAEAS